MKEHQREQLIALWNMLKSLQHPPKVLLVEDNPKDMNLTRSELESHGIVCFEARDGIEAIQKIKSNVFWVVFLDWKLFGMSGEETLKAILQFNPKMRVIILTGVLDPKSSDALRAMTMGAIAVMAKPLTSEQINLIFGGA